LTVHPFRLLVIGYVVADHFDFWEGLHSFDEALVARVEGLVTSHRGKVRDFAGCLACTLFDAVCHGDRRGSSARLNRFQSFGLIEKRPNAGWLFKGFTINFADHKHRRSRSSWRWL
jgi:hypothetical protein